MSVLNYRDEASCPTGNGTTYTSSAGFQYELYCNFDYKGKDLPSTDAKTYSACIDSCDSYSMDESEQDGANCVAAVFGAGDPNGGFAYFSSIANSVIGQSLMLHPFTGNQCWLKYAIDTVGTGGHMVYAARRSVNLKGSRVCTLTWALLQKSAVSSRKRSSILCLRTVRREPNIHRRGSRTSAFAHTATGLASANARSSGS